jgi:hypothetical protein
LKNWTQSGKPKQKSAKIKAMILAKSMRNELVNGLLPLLGEHVEQTERVTSKMGVNVIKAGTTTDVKGKPIEPYILYAFAETVQVKVNHKKRLLEVIKRAPTKEGMMEDLARYLVKYGKSKEAISESIRGN